LFSCAKHVPSVAAKVALPILRCTALLEPL
jgi:hypothetical protein